MSGSDGNRDGTASRSVIVGLKGWRLYVFATTIAAALLALVVTSESFEHCIKDRKHHHAYQALYEERSLLVKTIVRLELHAACSRFTIGENDGAITALATIALTGFTFALWRSTTQLWVATDRLVEGAKDTADTASRHLSHLEITEQPYVLPLIKHSFDKVLATAERRYSDENPAPESIGIDFTLAVKNYGRTPATLISVACVGAIWEEPPPKGTPIQMIGFILPDEPVLSAGDATPPLENHAKGLRMYRTLRFGADVRKNIATGQAHGWFVGQIKYRDMFGWDYVHDFLWRYHFTAGRFEPYEDKSNRTERTPTSDLSKA